MEIKKWFERSFSPITEQGLLAGIIERLWGTPIRLKEKTKGIDLLNIKKPQTGEWSVKKEIGHLIDLEPLWLGRIQDIIADKEYLSVADLENTKTHQTDYDSRVFTDLLAEFTLHRQQLIDLLRKVEAKDLSKHSKHPRLETPMKIVDLAYFVAEHDDHHLAKMNRLI